MPLILILIGVVLITYNAVSIAKEKKNVGDNDLVEEKDTFSGALKSADKGMNDFDVEIGRLRRDFAETITEIQKEIQGLKEDKEKQKKEEDKEDKKHKEKKQEKEKNSDVNIKSGIIKKENDVEENNNSIKIKKVEKLLNDNFTIDEISRELNISKGEVLLIKKLYSK